MENEYNVYKITCLVNRKIYIGYTKHTPYQRLQTHFRCAKKSSAINNKFANAIMKYGKDNFITELLFTFDNKDLALVKEIELIKEYKSISNGYNTTIGGASGPKDNKHADFSGGKNPMFGKKHSAEVCEFNRKNNTGKKRTLETIEKLKDITKGEGNPNAILTEPQVIEIRKLHFTDGMQKKDIAKLFNVKPACISKICSYRTWKHL